MTAIRLTATAAACYLPARAAGRVDPAVTLRAESAKKKGHHPKVMPQWLELATRLPSNSRLPAANIQAAVPL